MLVLDFKQLQDSLNTRLLYIEELKNTCNYVNLSSIFVTDFYELCGVAAIFPRIFALDSLCNFIELNALVKMQKLAYAHCVVFTSY